MLESYLVQLEPGGFGFGFSLWVQVLGTDYGFRLWVRVMGSDWVRIIGLDYGFGFLGEP